jgi:hypothetical protein
VIYIQGHWETVDSLRDIERIIKEYYNEELADEMHKLIEAQDAEIRNLQLELYNTPIYDDADDWCDD